MQLLTEAERLDGGKVAAYIADLKPRWMQATPTLYRSLIAGGWEGVGSEQLTCISSGEPLTPNLARLLLSRAATVVNCYGLTECTVFQCFSMPAMLSPQMLPDVSCGSLIYEPSYGRVYLLRDKDGRLEALEALDPTSRGVVGEIAFAGAMLPKHGYESGALLNSDKVRAPKSACTSKACTRLKRQAAAVILLYCAQAKCKASGRARG